MIDGFDPSLIPPPPAQEAPPVEPIRPEMAQVQQDEIKGKTAGEEEKKKRKKRKVKDKVDIAGVDVEASADDEAVAPAYSEQAPQGDPRIDILI